MTLGTMARMSSMAKEPEGSAYRCPRCGACGFAIRWGSSDGHRRVLCRKCGRTSVSTLGTVMYRSRIGPLATRLSAMLLSAGTTLRDTGSLLGISKTTALRYRHLMLGEIAKSPVGQRLSGHAWVDETYWPLPGGRDLGKWWGKAAIAIGRDESGHMSLDFMGMGKPGSDTLSRSWSGKLVGVTRLTHDALMGYEDTSGSLGIPGAKQDFEKSTAPGSHGAMSPIDRSCSGLKWFLMRRRGITARWLPLYLGLYQWGMICRRKGGLSRLAGVLMGPAKLSPTVNWY